LKTLVVMPTYNEASGIEQMLGKLLATVPDIDVLVVDDNSPDGTGVLVEAIAATDSRVSVLHRSEKNGLGPAYLAGFLWGLDRDYGFICEMDADGSHRPQDLPKLLNAALEADLVIGSRWVPGGKIENWPLSRQLISRIGNAYARVMLGAGVRDITAGFRVFRAAFLRNLDRAHVASAGYSFQVEMAYRSWQAGARIVEVPITFVERETGVSKMSRAIVFEALTRVTLWGLQRLVGKR